MVKTPPVKFYSIKSLILRYRKYIRLPAGCDCITLKMPVSGFGEPYRIALNVAHELQVAISKATDKNV